MASKGLGNFSMPQSSGNKTMGIQEIMPFVTMQAMMQRGQAGQSQLPSDSTVIGQHNPATGVNIQTKQGQQFEASGDLIKNSTDQAAKTALAMNLLDHYEKTYRDVYGDILDKGGVEGQLASSKKYATGYVMKQDPKLVAFHGDLPNIVSLLQRAVSETGNIAVQKEVREGKALPKLAPNVGDPANLFMPDDPQTALAKFHGLRSQLQDTLNQNLEMAKSGKVSVTQAQGDEASPVPGMTPQTKQAQDPLEGKTAINPQTKARMIHKGGKWQPLTT